MKRWEAGTSGCQSAPMICHAASLLPGRWSGILEVLTRHRPLRPVQWEAIERTRILESRRHLVVCAPTNSGKTLIGYLVLLNAVLERQRAVLLEPLRALAQERAEELSELLPDLDLGTPAGTPRVRLSTGDYRLDGEIPSAAPPQQGEIIVATPERLDAILRRPNHQLWTTSIGALVVDEAHMLADRRRGPTLEMAIASMLSQPAPPRMALLSATVGEPERLRDWLQPCQLITSSARTPLAKEVWELDAGEDPNTLLVNQVCSVLKDPLNAVIVFVYRRQSADALAAILASSLDSPVRSYHSGQSGGQRSRIRTEFMNGCSRCMVTTTALAMGVNLPATHVFLRDSTFFGYGRLQVPEILHILGRAGRGDRPGIGVVMVRPTDNWQAHELADALRAEVLPPLTSSFTPPSAPSHCQSPASPGPLDVSAATLIATCLTRAGDDGLAPEDLTTFFARTLAGQGLVSRMHAGLRWLLEPSRALAYMDERNRYHLTALGRSGTRSMLTLEYVAGVGQLVRDLISLDPRAQLLRRWSPLDHLLVIGLLSDRAPRLRPFSENLAGQIDAWIETRPADEKSLLFTTWIMGTQQASRADELFGSLGLRSAGPYRRRMGDARKRGYSAMLSALVLDERSRGISVHDLERRWSLSGLEGIEEGWRDTALWLLAGHTSLFDVRVFYHHLREACSATSEQVAGTKLALGKARMQAYDLMERLKHCSPLGCLICEARRAARKKGGRTFGPGTVRKLEDAGIRTVREVAQMSVDDLVIAGVQRRFAQQIRAYVRRRSR